MYRITLQAPDEPHWEARTVYRGGITELSGYMSAVISGDVDRRTIFSAVKQTGSFTASGPLGMYRMERVPK